MNSLHDAIGEYVDTLPDDSRKQLVRAQRAVRNSDLINELMDRLNDADRRMAASWLVGYLAADRDPEFIKEAVAKAAAAVGYWP